MTNMNNKEWCKATEFMDLIVIIAANHCRSTDKGGCFEYEIAFGDAHPTTRMVRTDLNSNDEEEEITRAILVFAFRAVTLITATFKFVHDEFIEFIRLNFFGIRI